MKEFKVYITYQNCDVLYSVWKGTREIVSGSTGDIDRALAIVKSAIEDIIAKGYYS